MDQDLKCPKCGSEHVYPDGSLWVCPECAHEWSQQSEGSVGPSENPDASGEIRDANGNVLADGDSVTVIKDLKIKGTSSVVKSGTKVKNIRLVDATDGHDIACKIAGIGAMNLKSEFVRKA
ncbi:zinc ribbon domain-containing protein YjdM [Gluconobacter wancherniae]|uniref:zinc ribbon domain-containing protein YjdM n=1 Tax=Gluconobacter wancherniae TaxID=1307955 RepID=UPI001B8C9E32|nr:zinc ribbon domain-containing protein YjdM [Gluconobacter wancherniae]MBS1062849.1 alkylphosphonate utilization protein [Gluconobacter wancherniae]MBS1094983.1 alkylphosphonate utilization protein [Gluconobacter wancherniae]